MNSPAVSVLVTVFNRETFLAECLESILQSSFEDFEVVVVDDRSTDASPAIAERFASSDSRVRTFRNDANLGDYPNRMRAATLAQGPYLKYVDSDDLIYSHSLAVMLEAMRKHPDAVLGLSHSRPEEVSPYPWRLSSAEAWQKEFLGDGCFGSGPTGAIIRRDAFFKLGGFRSWGVLSDTDMWYRLSAEWPVVLLPPGLVWWRRHENQEFTSNDAAVVYLEKGLELVAAALASAECPLSERERSEALQRSRQHFARKTLSFGLKGGKAREALRVLRESGLSLPEIMRGLSAYS